MYRILNRYIHRKSGAETMTEIRYVKLEDQEFWYRLDKHLPKQEFERKVREKRGYVLLSDRNPVGLLRYNLFWDNTPFCTMLYIDEGSRNKGHDSDLYSSGIDLCKYESSGCSKTGIAAGLYL